MRNFSMITLLLLTACGATPASTQTATPATGSDKMVGSTMEQHVLLNLTDLKWVDGPPSILPGAKMAIIEGDPKAPNALFTMRLMLPADFYISPHSHPADEHVTVISGTFNMGMGDTLDKNATTALAAGGFAVMPKDHHHFAWAAGETVIQVHGVGPWQINYVNPADDPRTAK